MSRKNSNRLVQSQTSISESKFTSNGQNSASNAFVILWNMQNQEHMGWRSTTIEGSGNVKLTFAKRNHLNKLIKNIQSNRKIKVAYRNQNKIIDVTIPSAYVNSEKLKNIKKNKRKWASTTAIVRSTAQGYENVFDKSMEAFHPQIQAKGNQEDFYLSVIQQIVPGVMRYFSSIMS